MTFLILATLLACDSAQEAANNVTSDVRSAAAKAKGAVSDMPDDGDGLASGCPTPLDSVDLEEARLGMTAPNAIKGMTVMWDAERNTLWHASIFSPYLVGHDAETGKPTTAIDMKVAGFNPNKLWLDKERDRMVFLSAAKEIIRAVDLNKGEVIDQVDNMVQGNRSYPTEAADLDIATGRLWVWNANSRELNGYSFDGQAKTPMSGMSNVIDISAAPSGGKLAIIDSTGKSSSRIVVVDTATGKSEVRCNLTNDLPNRVVMYDDGSVLLGSDKPKLVDANCKEKWSATIPAAAERWKLDGGYLIASMERGGFDNGEIGSKVALLDPETGRVIAKTSTRWETKSISVDSANNRIFVGNGGDGSATVLSLPDGKFQKHIQLASSADDVVVDSNTGDRYILSRLGGSRIYRWKEDGSFDLFTDQAPWPFALAIDAEKRLLLAPSFFEAKLYAWPLDGGKGFVIDLGIPASTGDSIGDFSYDPETGLAAVALPEEGWVSVVNVHDKKQVLTKQFDDMAVGHHSGPGAGAVAIANDSLYVGAPRLAKLWRVNIKTGAIMASATVKGLAGSGDSGASKGGKSARGGGEERPAQQERPAKQDREARPSRDGEKPSGDRPGRKEGRKLSGEKDGKPSKMANERPERGAKGGKAGKAGGDRPERGEGDERPARGGEEKPAGKAGGSGGEEKPAGKAGGGGQDKSGGTRRANPYVFELIHFDAAGGRLFFGSAVLDPNTLAESTSLAGGMKVMYSDANKIIAIAEGEGGVDVVHELDPKTLQSRKSWQTLQNDIVRAEGCYDPDDNSVILADLPRARVTEIPLN